MTLDTTAESARRPHWTALVAIGLLAGAIMLFELVLTRIFSFTIWHHFSFMVISVALMGFAVSGVVLQLHPTLGVPAPQRAAWYAVLFAITAVLAVALVTRIAFNPTRIAQEPVQILGLVAYYIALVVPFTFAGLAIVCLLSGYPRAVNRLYASDLTGAGAGCLLIVSLMAHVGAEGTLMLVGAIASAAAWLLRRRTQAGRTQLAIPWLAVTVLFGAAMPWATHLLSIRPGPGKGLTDWLDPKVFPHARLAFTQWNALSRVDVVEGAGNVSWTSNRRAPVGSPPQTQIVIDGDAATPIVQSNGDLQSLAFLDYTLSSTVLQAFRPAQVLVIGAGGGVDVLTALHHGAAHVDAVEINPINVDLVTRRYADWDGHLFERPEVALHLGEGRNFVRRQNSRYDMIQLSLIDTWAATAAGAYSLAEGYLYTVEAFQDYIDHLSDNGVLTVTRWRWSQPRETLKLCTVAVEAMRRLGVDHPETHIVITSLPELANVMIKRSAFTAADLDSLSKVADRRGFGFLYAPGIRGTNEFVRLLNAPDPSGFISTYPFDIRPATDNSPFFFQFGRWRDLSLAGWRESPLALSGRLVLLATLTQAFLLSLVLLVAPIVRRARNTLAIPRAAAGGTLAYFFAIGLGFMLLEISLMQRFTLFLGHPVYAIAFVLAVLLIAAGAGSMCAPRLVGSRRRPWLVFIGIVGIVLLYAAYMPAIFRAALGFSLASRLGVGALLLLPLGFGLGIPFPAAAASLSQRTSAPLLGWAWAANGCASVLGPILAVLLAMEFGFSVVMFLAAVIYAGAFVAFGSWEANAANPTG
jgi:spermidine synthase